MPKITKADMIDALNEHFAKQGKRITNLSKAKVDDLKALCVKYNIDMEKDQAKRDEEKREERKEAKVRAERERQERKEQEEKWEKEYKEGREKDNQDKEEYNALNDNVKEKLLDMYLEYLKNDFDKTIEQKKLNNIEAIKRVDLLEQTYKDKGIIVERPFPTTLVIKGIHIQYCDLADEEFDIKGYTDNWNKVYFTYKGFIVKYEEKFKVKVVIIGNDEIEML